MEWDAQLYNDKHDFVSEYGRSLVDLVPCDAGQVVLDLGCGTGDLTKALAEKSGQAVGVDGSGDMIRLARNRFPEIEFHVKDACGLAWRERFDIVFSNAVFHWIPDQRRLLEAVRGALKPGGKLICEFGAAGNIARIQDAFATALREVGHDFASPFYFPEADEYGGVLEESRLVPESVVVYERPTPLKGGASGLRDWVTQFFAGDMDKLSHAEREAVHGLMLGRLADALWDGGQWVADYRRIRVIAVRACC